MVPRSNIDDSPGEATGVHPQSRDRWIFAFGVGVTAFLISWALRQRTIFNDGPHILEAASEGRPMHHILIAPAVRLLNDGLGLLGIDVTYEAALRLLSCGSSSAVVALSFALSWKLFGSWKHGLVSAALLYVQPGFFYQTTASDKYAFHALSSAAFVSALLWNCQRTKGSAWSFAALTLSTAFSATTHISGVSLVLSALAGAWILRLWKRLLPPLALGYALAVGLYVYARVTHRAWFQVNEKIMLDAHYLKILTDPVDLYLSVRNGVSQYLLYGSALTVLSVFAYRLWRQDQRRLVVILAVASLGYLGPCGLIRNPIFGAYFVAAMFPLSVLAIPAAVECARNWGASLAVGALGVAPFVIEMLTPGWGPLGYLASVLGVFVLLRTQRGKPLPRSLVRSIALIGATALATTHFSLIPQLKRQRFRDDVNYVLERIPRDAVVLICSSSIEENLDAYLYCVYPERIGKGVDLGRTALPILRYNELALDVARLQMEDAFRQIAPTLNKGYTIWVLGDPHCYAPGTRSAEFIARVEASFRLQPVAGAPVQLAELVGRG